tara:strand:- start:3964 stop:4734 length:771 start_codon:yes stop_codon:yes gene_type:complete
LSAFIITKNNLTNNNSYPIIAFIIFVGFLFNNILLSEIIFAHFLVLLGIRRAISLKSGKQSISKIFDASLWISFSAILFPPSALFLIFLLLAIFIYSRIDLRNVGLIILGALTSILMSYLMLIVFYDFISISEFFTNLITNTIYDIDKGFSLRSIFVDVNTIIVFLILAISLIAYLIAYGIKSMGNIKTFLLISSILFIAFFINGYYMGNGSALIYLLLPFLVLVTKLIEISKRNWLLDLVVVFIIVFNLINQNLF